MTVVPARREAKMIARGEAPRPDTNEKVVLYGLLGRTLDLDALRAADLRTRGGFGDLEEKLAMALSGLAAKGYRDLDPDDIENAETIFSNRNSAARDLRIQAGNTVLFGPHRLQQGAKTGAHRVMATLRTIARELADGEESISQHGLEASVRVPFKISMLHLLDLGSERDYMETWKPKENIFKNKGDVFMRDSVSLDYTNGLNFLAEPAITTKESILNPSIGCPATLVRGYVEEVYLAAAQAAQDMDLIKAA